LADPHRKLNYVRIAKVASAVFPVGGSTVTRVAVIHYDVPDDVHRAAKAAAALQGVSLKAFLIEALQAATERAAKRTKGSR
jgi:hypothetical protein